MAVPITDSEPVEFGTGSLIIAPQNLNIYSKFLSSTTIAAINKEVFFHQRLQLNVTLIFNC